MKRKACEISNLSTFLFALFCSKCMRTICTYNNPAIFFLFFIFWMKQVFLLLNDCIYSTIITNYTSQIHRNDHFRFLSYRIFQLSIIHLIRIFCRIHQDKFCSDMTYHTCRRCIRICSCNHLISWSYSQNSQCHLQCSCCRIKTGCILCMTVICNFSFKCFGFWSCCNPATFQCIDHL